MPKSNTASYVASGASTVSASPTQSRTRSPRGASRPLARSTIRGSRSNASTLAAPNTSSTSSVPTPRPQPMAPVATPSIDAATVTPLEKPLGDDVTLLFDPTATRLFLASKQAVRLYDPVGPRELASHEWDPQPEGIASFSLDGAARVLRV